jgi:group I intron endonuclease
MVNPNRFYTYAYLREDRTPYYVGKGTGKRIYSKRKNISLPKDKSRIIFLKQNLTEEEAFKHEIYMIAVFGRKDLGTGILHNKTNGGDGISGFRHSEKSKNEMSKKRKGENNAFYGKKHSPETIKRLSKNKKGMVSVFLGKNHSQETKDKISNLKKGKYVGDKNPMFGKTHSQEAKDKISEANTGRVVSIEVRNEMSKRVKGENNPFFGKTHSQEARDKISKANIGKTCSEEIKQKISSFHNKLLRFISPSGEIVEEMTTIRKFCEKYTLSRKEISKVIKGELQQFKGWSVPIK